MPERAARLIRRQAHDTFLFAPQTRGAPSRIVRADLAKSQPPEDNEHDYD